MNPTTLVTRLLWTAQAHPLADVLRFAAVQAMTRMPGRSGMVPPGVPWGQWLIAAFAS